MKKNKLLRIFIFGFPIFLSGFLIANFLVSNILDLEIENKKKIFQKSILTLESLLSHEYEMYQRQIEYWANKKEVVLLSQKLNKASANQLDKYHAEGIKIFGTLLKPLNLEGFFIISLDGINLSSSRTSNIGLKSLLFKDGVSWNRALNNQSAISRMLKSDVPLPNDQGELIPSRPTQFVLHPITDDKNRIVSVLAFRIAPQKTLWEIIDNIEQNLEGELLVFDAEGVLQSPTRDSANPYNEVLQETIPYKAETFNEIINNTNRSFYLKTDEGDTVFRQSSQRYKLNYLYRDQYQAVFKDYLVQSKLIHGLIFTLCLILLIFVLFIMQKKDLSQVKTKQKEKIIEGILKTLPHGLVVANKKGEFIYFNKTAEHMLGLGPEGQSDKWAEIYGCYKEDGKTLFKEEELPIVQALKGNQSLNNKMIIRNEKLNEDILINVDSLTIYNDENEIEYGAVYFEDVTQKMKHEDNLNQIITEGRMIEQMGKIGGWNLDIKSGVTKWSDEVYRIHEVDVGTPTNKIDGISFYAPQERPRITKYVEDCIQQGKTFDEEFEFITNLGKKIWVRSMGRPVYDKNGEISHLIGTFQDISDIKKRDRDSELILSHVKVGIWEYDPLNNIAIWDKSMYDLYGVRAEDFGGVYEAWEQTLHPDDKERAAKELEDAILGNSDFDTTFAIIHGDGEIRHIGARAYITRDDQGAAKYIIGVNWDRTKEIEARLELEKEKKLVAHASKLASLGEMAAGVAHEISNPLAIITGGAGMLKKHQESPEKIVNSSEKILKATNRIKVIVDGLRKFSRKTDLPEKRNVVIATIFEECQQLSAPKLKGSDVDLKIVGDHSIEIFCNDIQIEQVLINLIGNAIDANRGKKNSWVELKTQTNHGFLEVIVRDSGVGIEDEVLEKLFDPFFTTKEVGKGTGLGLSISSGIAQDHGGHLEYRLIDGHTAFVLSLPLPASSEVKLSS